MDERPCICGKMAKFKIGTIDFSVGKTNIVVHNLPHFSCELCEYVSFDSGVNVDGALRYAFQKGLKEIDFKKKGEASMITYKIDVEVKLQREIEQAIEDKVDEIADNEEFTVIVGEKAALGKRSGDIVVIERIIEKIL